MTEKTVTLNKYITQCGLCSRRKADELIKNGEITVNQVTITEPYYKVQPLDVVRHKKTLLKPETFVYLAVNKPLGVVTTCNDPQGRPTVLDLVSHATDARLFHIGRLDVTTTGLILLTNDGELAQKLSHPRYKITKTYHVRLHRPLHIADSTKIKQGIKLSDGFVSVDKILVSSNAKQITIQLHSGKNRIIRRIFNSLGYQVKKLDRIAFGPITKKRLAVGQWRKLTGSEISQLKKL